MKQFPRSYWFTFAGVAYQAVIVALQHIDKEAPWGVLATPFVSLSMLAAALGAVAMHKLPRPDKWDGEEERRSGVTGIGPFRP